MDIETLESAKVYANTLILGELNEMRSLSQRMDDLFEMGLNGELALPLSAFKAYLDLKQLKDKHKRVLDANNKIRLWIIEEINSIRNGESINTTRRGRIFA